MEVYLNCSRNWKRWRNYTVKKMNNFKFLFRIRIKRLKGCRKCRKNILNRFRL